MVSRRRFLLQATGALSTLQWACTAHRRTPTPDRVGLPIPTPARLPRWRGFNLPELYRASDRKQLQESDFEWIAGWGFDFVRIPLDYRLWSDPRDWNRVDETRLRDVDRAVEWGRRYDVHVQLNFHRAPGYSVARRTSTSVTSSRRGRTRTL